MSADDAKIWRQRYDRAVKALQQQEQDYQGAGRAAQKLILRLARLVPSGNAEIVDAIRRLHGAPDRGMMWSAVAASYEEIAESLYKHQLLDPDATDDPRICPRCRERDTLAEMDHLELDCLNTGIQATATEQDRRLWPAVIDAIPTPIMVLDPKGVVIEANDACARKIEGPRQQLHGRHYAALFKGKRLDAIEQALTTLQPAQAELELKENDAFLVKVHPLVEAGAPPSGLVVAIEHVTERIRKESRLRHLLKHLSDPVLTLSLPSLELEHASEAALRVADPASGGTVADFDTWLGAVHEDDRERFRGAIRGCAETGRRFAFEARISARDRQSELWFEWQIAIEHDATGRADAIVAIGRDVTERNALKEAFEREMAARIGLQEMLPIAMAQKNSKGTFIDCNEAFARLVGLNRDAILNKHERPPAIDALNASTARFESTALDSLKAAQGTATVIDARGRRHYVSALVRPVFGLRGRVPEGILLALSDQTEAVRAQHLARIREEALNASSTAMLITNAAKKGNGIVYANPAFSSLTGYSREEVSGWNPRFLQGKDTDQPGRTLLREALDQGQHCDVTLRNYRKDGSMFWNRLVVSPILDYKAQATHFIGILNDISHRIEADDRRAPGIDQSLESKERAESALLAVVSSISELVRTRDPAIHHHHQGAAHLAVRVARRLGLDDRTVRAVEIAALVHDIGKISIPAEILNRPGPLTEIETTLIRTHPQNGYDILKHVDFPWPVADWVLQHHERIDGTGYPKGLSGEAITLEARILCVVDAVETICSAQPYRTAQGVEVALSELEAGCRTQFDERVVDACVDVLSQAGYRMPSAPSRPAEV